MEYEHTLNIKIMLDENEEAMLNSMVEEVKASGEPNVNAQLMLEKVVAYGVTQILHGNLGLGGGCGGCGCHGGCHGGEEDAESEGHCCSGCHEG